MKQYSSETNFDDIVDDEVLEALSLCKQLTHLNVNANPITMKGLSLILQSKYETYHILTNRLP
jgi:hypothetical protein